MPEAPRNPLLRGRAQERVEGKAESWEREALFSSADLERNYGAVDPRTFNLGSTLVHELYHAVTDKEDEIDGVFLMSTGWTGPVVDFVNVMRAERGLPLRANYVSEPTILGNMSKLGFKHVNPRKPDKIYYVVRNGVN